MDPKEKTGLDAVAKASEAVSKTDHETALATAAATAKTDAATAKADGEKAGAQAAQARIKAILTHKEAAGRDALASHLAFNTSLPVEEAVAMLATAAKAEAATTGSRLDALMAGEKPAVAEHETTNEGAVMAGLTAAVAKNLAKIGKAPLTLN